MPDADVCDRDVLSECLLMEYANLIEIVAGIHLSRYVTSPYASRGGFLIVAPAGQLKSTAIDILDLYPDAKVLSDLNVQSLIKLRDDIVAGDVQTLAFSDLEKLYKRHAAVASNVEGILMALVEEGFRKASFQDQRMVAVPARATVIGALTLKFYETKVTEWSDNGFLRRFLVAHYSLSNAWKLEHAILDWRKHQLDLDFSARLPANREIPYHVTARDQTQIARCLKHQRSRLTPRIVLGRLVSVLRWKFPKHPKRVDQMLSELADLLGPNGGTIHL
jgi:hypothetical protein